MNSAEQELIRKIQEEEDNLEEESVSKLEQIKQQLKKIRENKMQGILIRSTGLQIYGGPGSLSHDFKIWPITFQGSGPSGPILFSGETISLY